MAVLQVPMTQTRMDRVRALGGIARSVLAIRLVCCLLVAGWAIIAGHEFLVLGMGVMSLWLIGALLHWDRIGERLIAHPALLALDVLVCLGLLLVHGPTSPVLLLLGGVGVLVGLCLGTRGALVFSPILVFGCWLATDNSWHEVTGADGDAYLALLVIPVVLCGTVLLGVGTRESVLEADRLEREQRRQTRLAGVAEERARISREMHDSMVKSLQGVALLAETLPAWLERKPERAAEQAREVARMLKQATVESREMVVAMRRADATASLASQVATAVSRWEQNTGRPARLTVEEDAETSVEPGYELLAVLEEALENVHRHTPVGTEVHVDLHARDGWVLLTVTDDGPGSDLDLAGDPQPKAGHFGVVGMRERAARAGGALTISAPAGRGTTVRLRIPAAVDSYLEDS